MFRAPFRARPASERCHTLSALLTPRLTPRHTGPAEASLLLPAARDIHVPTELFVGASLYWTAAQLVSTMYLSSRFMMSWCALQSSVSCCRRLEHGRRRHEVNTEVLPHSSFHLAHEAA